MTCTERDQDLLLLAHGALPFWTRLRVLAHVKHCAECRSRLTDLTQRSLLVASAVRGPSLPPWSHAQAAARTSFPILVWLIALSVVVLITVVCLVARSTLMPSRHALPSVASGCRPDLPNSRCR